MSIYTPKEQKNIKKVALVHTLKHKGYHIAYACDAQLKKFGISECPCCLCFKHFGCELKGYYGNKNE